MAAGKMGGAGILAILAPKGDKKKPAGPPDMDAPEGDEDLDMGEGKIAAAEDILDALASKDAPALSEALSAHYDLCAGRKKSKPESDDEY